MAYFRVNKKGSTEIQAFVPMCTFPTLPSAGGFSFTKNGVFIKCHNDSGSYSNICVSILIDYDTLYLFMRSDFSSPSTRLYITTTSYTGTNKTVNGTNIGAPSGFVTIDDTKGKYLTFYMPYQSGGSYYHYVAIGCE